MTRGFHGQSPSSPDGADASGWPAAAAIRRGLRTRPPAGRAPAMANLLVSRRAGQIDRMVEVPPHLLGPVRVGAEGDGNVRRTQLL